MAILNEECKEFIEARIKASIDSLKAELYDNPMHCVSIEAAMAKLIANRHNKSVDLFLHMAEGEEIVIYRASCKNTDCSTCGKHKCEYYITNHMNILTMIRNKNGTIDCNYIRANYKLTDISITALGFIAAHPRVLVGAPDVNCGTPNNREAALATREEELTKREADVAKCEAELNKRAIEQAETQEEFDRVQDYINSMWNNIERERARLRAVAKHLGKIFGSLTVE